MNYQTIKLWLLVVVATLATQSAFADFAHDTVWYKQTDQTYGFWKLEFSDNDSLIAASGYNDVIFYETATGKEIIRIPGQSEVVFINNGANFIKANKDKTKLEIWDTKTFTQIDTLECNGNVSSSFFLSKDKKLLLGDIRFPPSLMIWDLTTKKLLRTHTMKDEKFLKKENSIWGNATLTADNSEIWLYEEKIYHDPTMPGPGWATKANLILDANTFEVKDTLRHKSSFMLLSQNNKYYGMLKLKSTDIEIYDFNTRELIHTFQLAISSQLSGLKYSSDEKYLVTSADNGLRIWDLATGKIKYNDYTGGSISSIALSHNMKYIVASGGSSFVLFHGRYDYVDVADSPKNTGTLYPNPTTGTYTLSYNQFANESTTIQITDLQGNIVKPIFSGFIEQGIKTYNISVNELPNGTYFLRLISKNQNTSYKFIKE